MVTTRKMAAGRAYMEPRNIPLCASPPVVPSSMSAEIKSDVAMASEDDLTPRPSKRRKTTGRSLSETLTNAYAAHTITDGQADVEMPFAPQDSAMKDTFEFVKFSEYKDAGDSQYLKSSPPKRRKTEIGVANNVTYTNPFAETVENAEDSDVAMPSSPPNVSSYDPYTNYEATHQGMAEITPAEVDTISDGMPRSNSWAGHMDRFFQDGTNPASEYSEPVLPPLRSMRSFRRNSSISDSIITRYQDIQDAKPFAIFCDAKDATSDDEPSVSHEVAGIRRRGKPDDWILDERVNGRDRPAETRRRRREYGRNYIMEYYQEEESESEDEERDYDAEEAEEQRGRTLRRTVHTGLR